MRCPSVALSLEQHLSHVERWVSESPEAPDKNAEVQGLRLAWPLFSLLAHTAEFENHWLR